MKKIKDLCKNPALYYTLIPALLALWPLSIAFVYMPGTTKKYQDEKKLYEVKAEKLMFDIIDLDQDRKLTANTKEKTKDFDYATALALITSSSGISANNYTYTTRAPLTKEDRKIQTATVEIQKIEIQNFADFLDKMQKRWANLECESIDLDKLKGPPNEWKATVKFKYYF
jgi:hypothetical protein